MKAVESSRFFEFLDKVRPSLDDPDEQLVHQIFEIPKRRILEIDHLLKSRKLDPSIAEDRRFRIQTIACSIAYRRVLNSWNTRDKLDEVFARYQSIVYGRESECRKGEENLRRTEAVRQFEDIQRVLQMAVNV